MNKQFLLLICILLFGGVGCASIDEYTGKIDEYFGDADKKEQGHNIPPPLETSFPSKDAHKINQQGLVQIGKSVYDRDINIYILGRGSETIFFLGSLHGDYHFAPLLVNAFVKYLQQNHQYLRGRRVILIPFPNPDGYRENSRYNANGIDLNRNFFAENRENNARNGYSAFSEPETQLIARLIESYKPNRIIHVIDWLQCIDYDGPAKPLAYHMKKYVNLPVDKQGAMPGSLGSYAGLTLSIPTITFALHKDLQNKNVDSNYLLRRYGNALLAAIIYPSRLSPPFEFKKRQKEKVVVEDDIDDKEEFDKKEEDTEKAYVKEPSTEEESTPDLTGKPVTRERPINQENKKNCQEVIIRKETEDGRIVEKTAIVCPDSTGSFGH